MQFNSYLFILLFLPLTVLAYFVANKINSTFGKLILIVSSIIFYAYSGFLSISILTASILVNYAFVILIPKKEYKRLFLVFPIGFNVLLLLFFKYSGFLLPLGISFFTFQQIAYLAAVQKKEIKSSPIDYLVYILYFPKLLMGPLCEPMDFINEINNNSSKKVNWDNIACGIKLLSFGLFKKVILADTFAKAVTWGHSNFEKTTSIDWILIMLFYTFEIYFDFSGYCDMGLGVSKMMNIKLPINFDSPYKAISIRDFWKRWHISLTKFFTKYVYFNLGGSKKGNIRTYLNVLIVFLISGIWHGSTWTFVLWGTLHGVLNCFERATEKVQNKIVKPVRWIITFAITNILWLLFSCKSVSEWFQILIKTFSFDSLVINDNIYGCFSLTELLIGFQICKLGTVLDNCPWFFMAAFSLFAAIICFFFENNYKKQDKNNIVTMVLAVIAFVWSFISLCGESVFVYYNF